MTLATIELTKSFGGVHAVDHATVEFRDGKINAVIGPNGSGKTTFFNCVTGMIRPDSGSVSYRGRDVTGRAPHRIAAAGIGRSFQLCRIFPRMTVRENVLAAVRPRGIAGLLRSAGVAADIERARGWLRRVGIDHLEDIEARNLSYGQQKLVELAQILMVDPKLIMLDEPAGGINPTLIERIGEMIRELNSQGKTFLLVEHNMPFVLGLCHPVLVLARGACIAQGQAQDIQA
ncbi:MAG: ABC transporter ATP-binding protein, partial [Pseudonocardia sp.]